MSIDTLARSIDILLVEDNPGDVRLTRELLKGSKIHNNLTVVDNGEDAVAFLHRGADDPHANLPDLILLDLNLPRKNGVEVLSSIKSDPELRRIPVVVLTSSKAEEDIAKTYDLHANCYISKPVGLEQFAAVVKSIDNFWLSIVKLPTRHER
jgi:two-component system, chemotaxis family, response regulator Rcp1